ncbi:MAG: hypothetical protein NTY87_02420 [Planctomycetia bacterium]|nr:hypothetical protein [Planctomycetia bacterium]
MVPITRSSRSPRAQDRLCFRALGTIFTIIDNVGLTAVNGTFNGLPEAALITANKQTYQISYVGGTGNDVTLTVVPTITDDIVVTVVDSNVVLSLASKGVTITDLHTSYSSASNSLTITATNGGTISSSAGGITVDSKLGTITVSLTTIPTFAGISLVGNSGVDSVKMWFWWNQFGSDHQGRGRSGFFSQHDGRRDRPSPDF